MTPTPRQKILLDFIREEITTRGVSPSFDEMMAFMGFVSKSAVHRMVTQLEARGLIHRETDRARSIMLPAEPSKEAMAAMHLVKQARVDLVFGNIETAKASLDKAVELFWTAGLR